VVFIVVSLGVVKLVPDMLALVLHIFILFFKVMELVGVFVTLVLEALVVLV
jgi:hypothetical protein